MMFFLLLLLFLCCPVGAVFQPGTKGELQAAVREAAKGTWTGDAISTWDVSQATDMSYLFCAYDYYCGCGDSCPALKTYNPTEDPLRLSAPSRPTTLRMGEGGTW